MLMRTVRNVSWRRWLKGSPELRGSAGSSCTGREDDNHSSSRHRRKSRATGDVCPFEHSLESRSFPDALYSISVSSSSCPSHPGAHSYAFSVPNLPRTEWYSGSLGAYCSLLVQYFLTFQLQPSSFPTEQSQMSYIISFLSGSTKQWGTIEWEKQPAVLHRLGYRNSQSPCLSYICCITHS